MNKAYHQGVGEWVQTDWGICAKPYQEGNKGFCFVTIYVTICNNMWQYVTEYVTI